MVVPAPVVGIDVAKDHLDVAIGLDTPPSRFDNTPKGHRSLARVLVKASPKRIVLEATVKDLSTNTQWPARVPLASLPTQLKPPASA